MKQFDANIEKLKARKPKTKANTRIAEVFEPYEQLIAWQNETLTEDRRILYIAVYRFMKHRTEKQLTTLLDWIKGKNLHPLAVAKLLNGVQRRESRPNLQVYK